MPLVESTKTAGDVATYVQRQFGDESETQIKISDILRWLNTSQLDIVRRNRLNKRISTVTATIGQSNYDFPSNNIVHILGISFNDNSLDKTSLQEYLRQKDEYLDSGTPIAWYPYEDSIYLIPKPDTAGTIKLYHSEAPTVCVTTSDALTIPDTYFQVLCQAVLQQAYELDEDMPAYQYKEQQVDGRLNELLTDTSAYYPTVVVLEEDL